MFWFFWRFRLWLVQPGRARLLRIRISGDHSQLEIKIACVGDSSDGSVPNTAISTGTIGGIDGFTYDKAGYYLFDVWTVAGTGTAPDAADITINDATGKQIFDQDSVLAATGTTKGDVTVGAVTSELTVVTANQDTASATWDLYLLLVR